MQELYLLQQERMQQQIQNQNHTQENQLLCSGDFSHYVVLQPEDKHT